MHVSEKLSSAMGHRDQGPNRALAREIIDQGDAARLKELVVFFLTQPKKDLQNDCVLTIAWVAEEAPDLVAPYADQLIANLNSPINRVIWGSMISLSAIAHLVPDKLYHTLPKVLSAMDASTVITRDYGFRVLTVLYALPDYQEDVLFIILEQLRMAPSNQIGQYTDRLLPVFNSIHKEQVLNTLTERLQELSNPHHIRRLNKNMLKFSRL